MNKIETKPIKDLILNKETPNRKERFEHFFIPYYQRGYRWEQVHVEALLDDIHNFIQLKEENYCLQPIVVTSSFDEDGLNRWEVIDGQQRLISLYIIFKYIRKPRYSIIFDKRGRSNSFLEKLDADTYDYSHPDFAFMSKAHQIVKKWFEKKTEYDISYIDDFYSRLTRNVQVIWYETSTNSESEKIDVFNRLNIGKIPLTDAELIRALLLSKMKNGLSEREAYLRQSELSNEWSQIEHDLRVEELWYFLTSGKEKYSSHIEFIFKLLAGNGKKKYSTYLWFEQMIKNENPDSERKMVEELWGQTKSLFAKFKYWYNERTLYHHIGYLLLTGTTIDDIIANSKVCKSEFKKWLIVKTKEKIKGVDLSNIGYEDSRLLNILLLHNILSVENLVDNSLNRFPFNHFKKVANTSGWSIEHIHAQQSEPLKEDKAIRTWLEDTYSAIKNISIVEREQILMNDKSETKGIESIELGPFIKRLEIMMKEEEIDTDDFAKLNNELLLIFDSSSVHDLENLALLSRPDNSALKNAIFPVKRNKIISIEKEGNYIPHCTRNAFLKFYSNSDNQPYYWSRADKESYFNSIHETLKPYLINHE